MGPVRLADIRSASACREFRFRAGNKSVEYRLVKHAGDGPESIDMRFDLFANGNKVKTLLERAMRWSSASNVSAELINGSLDLSVIDLGAEVGGGAGFAIMNILAKIAQERNAGLSLLSLSNIGLLHMLGRVSDFRYQRSAHGLFSGTTSLYVAPERLAPRARFIFIPHGDSRYICIDDRVATVTFSDKGPKKVIGVECAKKTRFSPRIRIGTKFSDLTFNRNGALSVGDKKAGYPVFFEPSIESIVGMDPKPVDSFMVEEYH